MTTRRNRRRRVRVVVIGAGQAGLAAAYHLKRAGLRAGEEYLVLDGDAGPGGAWRHRPPHLTLGATHGIHALPAWPVPDLSPDTPAAVAVPEYFGSFEEEHDLPVRRPVHVRAVREANPALDPTVDRDGLLAVVTDRGTWTTDAVISATGTWSKAFWPSYPGRGDFRGRQLHSRDFRGPIEFAGQHVVVVGGGTSAVQTLLQLAGTARTTWVTRRPPQFLEGEFTEEERRSAVARVAEAVSQGRPVPSVVSVTGLRMTPAVRAGIESGAFDRRAMFTRMVADGVVWDDAEPVAHLPADAILWATGFRAALDHLAPLGLRARGGGIVLDGTAVAADPRVHLVGYGPSASTVGATRAGRDAVRRIVARL